MSDTQTPTPEGTIPSGPASPPPPKKFDYSKWKPVDITGGIDAVEWLYRQRAGIDEDDARASSVPSSKPETPQDNPLLVDLTRRYWQLVDEAKAAGWDIYAIIGPNTPVECCTDNSIHVPLRVSQVAFKARPGPVNLSEGGGA